MEAPMGNYTPDIDPNYNVEIENGWGKIDNVGSDLLQVCVMVHEII